MDAGGWRPMGWASFQPGAAKVRSMVQDVICSSLSSDTVQGKD